ncbi:DUF3713 domain-containing protein [Ureaplasma canigenitalium]|uniref:DUF3713 domain-containing protein n=1 Tax=Ureaplasma canigenitalium TaxID=42092 RepID=UPI0004E1CAAF|nr:DUF3713 domain-containing protein [Ureaplasma canigenitalium]
MLKKKLFITLASSSIILSAIATIAVSCRPTERTSNIYKALVDAGDGKQVSNFFSTRDALKQMLFSNKGYASLNKGIAKQVVYHWAKNNNNARIKQSVLNYEKQLDSQYDEVKGNFKRFYPNDAEIAFQNQFLNARGGSQKLWKYSSSVDEAYKMFTNEFFDQYENLISIKTSNGDILATDSEAEVLLGNYNEIFKQGDFKVQIKAIDDDKKGYADLLDFLINDYVKYNLPISFSHIDFPFDKTKSQEIYDKEYFKSIPETGNDQFPYFEAHQNNISKTSYKYEEVAKLINQKQYLDLKNFNNIDQKYNQGEKSVNEVINLTELLNKNDEYEVSKFSYLLSFMRLFGVNEDNLITLEQNQLNEKNPLFNFVYRLKDKPDVNSMISAVDDFKDTKYTKLFFPSFLKNASVFKNDLANTIAVSPLAYINDQLLTFINKTGISIIGINDFNNLKTVASQNNIDKFYQALKHYFIYQGALYLSSYKPSSSVVPKGVSIKEKLRSYFEKNMDRILSSYYAEKNDSNNFLFKDAKSEKVISDEASELVRKMEIVNLENTYRKLETNLVNGYRRFNAVSNPSLNTKEIFNKGLQSPLLLSTTNNQNLFGINLVSSFINLFIKESRKESDQKLLASIDEFLTKTNVESKLSKVNKLDQIIFDDYLLHSIFNDNIGSRETISTLKNLILLKNIANNFNGNDISIKSTIKGANILNDGLNKYLKLFFTINGKNNYHINSSKTIDELNSASNLIFNNELTDNGLLDPNSYYQHEEGKSTFLLETLSVINWLLSIENNVPTFKNLKAYLKRRINEDGYLFIGYKALGNKGIQPSFGANTDDDFKYKSTQLDSFNAQSLFNHKRADVYHIENDQIKLNESFVNSLGFANNISYYNTARTIDGKEYNGFVGLITKDNLNAKLGDSFKKISPFDPLVFTNNPAFKARGSLAKYYSKDNLKMLVSKFTTYNQFKKLAEEIHLLNINKDVNIPLDTIIKNKKETTSSAENKNTINSIELSLNELLPLMNKAIDHINDEAFKPVVHQLVYHKLDSNPSALVKQNGNSDIVEQLLLTQITGEHIDQITDNLLTTDEAKNLFGLSKDEMMKIIIDLALNDQVLKINALSEINKLNTNVVYDRRINVNDASLYGFLKYYV